LSEKDPKVIDIVPRRHGEEDMAREELAELRERPLDSLDKYREEKQKDQPQNDQHVLDPHTAPKQTIAESERLSAEPRPRPRFVIINTKTGERIGETRKSTLDQKLLQELFPNLGGKTVRIAKIIWADYDEVEIHVIGLK